jgi:hypothetical protein
VSSDGKGRERKVRVAALVPLTLVVLLIFVLLASMVSWPWHNPCWTRADFNLASQRQPGDTALTSQLVKMSLAAKLEGARAGCPTFSLT